MIALIGMSRLRLRIVAACRPQEPSACALAPFHISACCNNCLC